MENPKNLQKPEQILDAALPVYCFWTKTTTSTDGKRVVLHLGVALDPFSQSSELRYTANTQLEHLHARYTGTGHADLSKFDWVTHQHRDTLSSIVGHPTLTSFLAIADGESLGRVKFEMTEKMLQPTGPPPKKDDD
ncbi:RING finger domain protein [Mycena chlorophos]|uniref:RING finger domain protein n=1 Tax=Mycena chlorophos TaxID=658473 RepID=A0A8H6SPI9_MYCCL|nr:RING finger domain protein [Mycena chlorophos]